VQTAFGAAETELRDVPATVKNGVLPAWLTGSFYRNGPGTYKNGSPGGMTHLFDGYGMLVKVELRGGTNSATVSNAFIRSSAYKAFARTGRMAWREFGTPRQMETGWDKAAEIAGTIGGALGLGETKGVTDNASVNVIARGRDANGVARMWAMTETVPGTFEIDPETLHTTGRVRYTDGLEGTLTTAHPFVDDNGTLYNLLSVPGKGFTVYKMADDGRDERRKVADVPHRRPLSPAWIHDFPGCPEALVVPETPLYFNLASLTLGREGSHLFMDWIPEDGTTLHVVELGSAAGDGEPKVCSVSGLDPFFVFHWANAYVERQGTRTLLHLDACVYDDPDIVEHLRLETIRMGPGEPGSSELPPSGLRRITLEKDSQDAGQEGRWRATSRNFRPLSEDEARDFGGFADFPTVSPRVRGSKHRYVWVSGAVRPTNVTNALVRHDLETSTSLFWHEPGALPGESCFVPRPGGVDEDDGVILSSLIERDGASSLLVLDARTMREVCRVAIDGVRVPSGFHGSFIFS
jgi:carlactone synthase/all-trans-10'-apo-beta-carotenal 13,14-cleaving dioxygenase